jgi:hypothetical protein
MMVVRLARLIHTIVPGGSPNKTMRPEGHKGQAPRGAGEGYDRSLGGGGMSRDVFLEWVSI